jgi:hypothetical protein
MDSNDETSTPPRVDKKLFKQLTNKISLVNKRMLNETIQLSNLEKLEKEALRGAATERPEPKSVKRSQPKLDYLSLILKSEHKVNSNTCIVKLPKMPFGRHKDYNEEPKFVMNHFIQMNRKLEDPQADDLSEITKKFRLQDKQKTSQKRNNISSKPRYFKDFDTFDMNHGELKCERNQMVVNSYLNDKEKYRKYLYQPPGTVRNSRKRIDRAVQEQSVGRLHQSLKQNESNISSFYTSKYSRLFSRDSGCHSSPRVPNLDLSVINL